MKAQFGLSVLAAGAVFAAGSALAAGPEVLTTECARIVAGTVVANTPCTVKVFANASSASEEWTWDDGTRTVVKMSDHGIFVDDRAAAEVDGSEYIDLETYCYAIEGGDEIYCSGK